MLPSCGDFSDLRGLLAIVVEVVAGVERAGKFSFFVTVAVEWVDGAFAFSAVDDELVVLGSGGLSPFVLGCVFCVFCGEEGVLEIVGSCASAVSSFVVSGFVLASCSNA